MNKMTSPIIRTAFKRLRPRRLFVLMICLLIAGSTVWPVGISVAARGDGKRRTVKKSARQSRKALKRPRKQDMSSRVHLQEPSQEEEEIKSDDAEKRENWFLYERAYPFSFIPAGARRRAWESRPFRGKDVSPDGVGVFAAESQQSWTPIGPAPTEGAAPANWGATSGRINAIAIHPSNPNIILIGASTGGIWRSTNGGQSFAPVSDAQVDLAVGAIAFAPSNPNVVYAGMGDIDNSYVGTGVLRSTDAGATWTRVNNATFPEQGFVTDIAVDPQDSNRVYITQDLSLNTGPGSTAGYTFSTSGLWISADGGVTWSRTLGGRARNLAVHPSNPNIIYVAMRTADQSFGGVQGIYKSTGKGATGTFNLVYTSPYGTSTRDIQVAVTPAAPENLYVYVGRTASPREVRVELSTNGGQTWSDRAAAGVTNIDTGQFGYNTYIEVSPADPDSIYIGARDIFKTTNGTQASPTWTNITDNFHNPPSYGTYNPSQSDTHPDQHVLAFDPQNANTVYAGNDGGISRATNASAADPTFTSLNATLSLTQFIHLSLHPTDPNISFGGSQDNGTQRRVGGGLGWKEFSSGDGGRSVINPADNSMVFTTYIYGRVNRFTNNGLNFSGTLANTDTFGEDPNAPRIAFYPPLVGNGIDHKLYFGTWKLYVCDDCNDTSKRIATGATSPTWTVLGDGQDLTKGGGDVLETIAVARSNTNVIYTGSRNGQVMVSGDGGATWNVRTSGLPNRVIKSIVISPTNPDVAYLTVSGYVNQNDSIKSHVFRTTNRGVNWTEIGGVPGSAGALPNIPTNAFLIDPLNPNSFYVGTDIGVFRSTNGGTTWETFSTGMPPVVVTALAAQPTGRIQAATYGRGAYELTGAPPQTPTVAFTTATDTAAETAGKITVTVTRNDSTGAASVGYTTADATAVQTSDYTTASGRLNFNPGETSRSFTVFITNDALLETPETFTVNLSNPSGATLGVPSTLIVTIDSDDVTNGPNPVRDQTFDAQFFVRQHYIDFFNREADAPGLAFWTNQITECEQRPEAEKQNCREVRRINVSAAFFVSTEFQQTGYLVYKAYGAAFGRTRVGSTVPLTLLEFLPDTQRIGSGIIVNSPGWEQQLEANKTAYFLDFVQRPAFLTEFPESMSNTSFVDKLNTNIGGHLTDLQKASSIGILSTTPGPLGRAAVVRSVSENALYDTAERNRAFVLMQYIGYLRRNPSDAPEPTLDFAGYNFWLSKLNQFNGNYIDAEMVKAFITSGEYIGRFGQ